jgi:hypothetical protein
VPVLQNFSASGLVGQNPMSCSDRSTEEPGIPKTFAAVISAAAAMQNLGAQVWRRCGAGARQANGQGGVQRLQTRRAAGDIPGVGWCWWLSKGHPLHCARHAAAAKRKSKGLNWPSPEHRMDTCVRGLYAQEAGAACGWAAVALPWGALCVGCDAHGGLLVPAAVW